MINQFSSTMSVEKRFDNHNGFAAWSLGSPNMIHAVDKKEFRKTVVEIGKLYTLKKQLPKARKHKFVTYLKTSF